MCGVRQTAPTVWLNPLKLRHLVTRPLLGNRRLPNSADHSGADAQSRYCVAQPLTRGLPARAASTAQPWPLLGLPGPTLDRLVNGKAFPGEKAPEAGPQRSVVGYPPRVPSYQR